eukprot:15290311-Alexandrium_andersonii.AAC.1
MADPAKEQAIKTEVDDKKGEAKVAGDKSGEGSSSSTAGDDKSSIKPDSAGQRGATSARRRIRQLRTRPKLYKRAFCFKMRRF